MKKEIIIDKVVIQYSVKTEEFDLKDYPDTVSDIAKLVNENVRIGNILVDYEMIWWMVK